MDTNLQNQFKYYKHLKLSWCIQKMLYINDAGITIDDLLNENNLESITVFILFGLDKPDMKRAIDIVEAWVELFGDYKYLRTFIVMDLKEKHKFLVDKNEDEDIVDIFEIDFTQLNKEKTHEDILRDERENLEHAITVYMKVGYKYEDAIEKDLSNYEFFNDYVLKQREDLRKDLHKLSYWIGVAINNPKKFGDTVSEIRLRPLSREEKIEEIKNNTIEMYKAMKEDSYELQTVEEEL